MTSFCSTANLGQHSVSQSFALSVPRSKPPDTIENGVKFTSKPNTRPNIALLSTLLFVWILPFTHREIPLFSVQLIGRVSALNNNDESGKFERAL